MPRKKKPPKLSPLFAYEEYAGYFTPEMRRRAMAAGCRTIAEAGEWLDRSYGADSSREQNNLRPPPPYRWPAKP